MSVTREKRFHGTSIRLVALFLSILLLGSSIATFNFSPKTPKLMDSVSNTIPSPPLTVLGPPSKVQGLVVMNEGSGDKLNITWQANPELNVSHYDLYRNSTSNPLFIQIAMITGRLNTFYQDALLTEYENNSYYVIAIDTAGNESMASDLVTGTPIDTKPPGPPSVAISILPPSQIFLIIIAPPDLDTAAYNIYQWNESLGDWQLIATIPTIFSWPVPPDNSSSYYFCVTALDEKLQESIPSNIVSITIPPLFPPDFLQLTSNANGDIMLNWSRNPINPPHLIARYEIYRMNSSEIKPSLIGFVPFTGVDDYSYVEYGVPNGNWTYFILTLDHLNVTSYISSGVYILINDVVAPGPPIFDRIENYALHWFPPPITDFGADVLRYEIWITKKYITNVSGLLPNGTIWGQIYPNGTIYEPPRTFYNFSPLPDGIWYVSLIAYDELGNPSSYTRINWTIDTIDPTIIPESITNLTGLDILERTSIFINVSVSDVGGISEVWLNYTIDGTPQIPILMTMIEINNTSKIYVFSGTIPNQPAGVIVNYSITVFDKYGHWTTSDSFTFTVVAETLPWPFLFLLSAITAGTVCAAIIVYNKIKVETSKKPKQTETAVEIQ